ncbi:MAG: PEP-CTERM sorting domain-containing protein [Bryobacteraceae bacterium]
MRFVLVFALAALTGSAFADTITTLHNTGNGAAGTADLNWTLVGGTAYVTNNGFPFPYWFADNSTSSWISPQASYNPGSGDPRDSVFEFQTTFTLPQNFNFASIMFQAATDNALLDVQLNGSSVGFPLTPETLPGDNFTTNVIAQGSGFASGLGSPLTITNGFLAGTNTLSFFVQNSATNADNTGNPAGLNVAFSSDFTTSATPEPSSFLLLGSGLLLGGGFLRRRRLNK